MVPRRSVLIAACGLLVAGAASADVNRWTSLGPPGLFEPPPVASIAVAPDAIYAATPFGVYRGDLDGLHWENALPSLLGGASVVAVAPSDPEVVYAAGGARLQRSDNGGESWRTFFLPGLLTSNLAVDPSDPRTVWVGTGDLFGNGALYRSRNGGESWLRVLDHLSNVQNIAIDFTDSKTIYVAAGLDLFRTRDEGVTWVRHETIPKGIGVLAIDPLTPSRLFANERSFVMCPGFCLPQSLWRSDDSGASWSRMLTFPAEFVGPPIVDSLSTLYVPSDQGVLLSRDHGDTWSPVEPGSTLVPETLALHPADPSRLFAGTYHGVYGIQIDPDGPCAYPGTTLCLHEGRFEVTVTRRTSPTGPDLPAQAVPVTRESGYFWFFDPDNVEVMVKVLDGRFVNGHFWVFFGALSNVAYTVTVRDTETGETRVYENPAGVLASVADTAAFPVEDSPPPHPASETGTWRREVGSPAIAPCHADSVTLCLNGGRFRVQVTHQPSPLGPSLPSAAVPLTDDTGYFWFFQPHNVELVVKVIDGRPVNGHFWVFSGALSNVGYTISITDTETGEILTYTNPFGVLSSAANTTAF